MPTALSKTLGIVSDLIPEGRPNRPRKKIEIGGITVHNTDNSDKGADAKAHGKFLSQVGYYMYHGEKHWVSWHYTIDDTSVHQHLPVGELGWHAGPGNASTIGIEICMCEGIDQSATNVRAAVLIAGLLNDLKLDASSVVPHHHWTGKNCPIKLLEESQEGMKWKEFINMVNAILRNLDQKTRAILSAEEVKTLSTTPAEPLSREDIENDLDHGSIRIPDELLSQ